MDSFSYLGNNEIATIDQLYNQYLENPDSVDKSWHDFFKGFDFARKNYATSSEIPELLDKEFKVIRLIEEYRRRGHFFTKTNPVRTRRKYFPTLDLENYGLSQKDLSNQFQAGKEIGIGPASLKQIVEHLEQTYCQSIGAEYTYIRDNQKLKWLKLKMEGSRNTPSFSKEEKQEIYHNLKQAVGFERFIHKKFVGQKRFSLEGTETLIPALHALINHGANLNVEEFVIGMAHRGRLNVLENVMQKPAEIIFKEFVANEYDENIAQGDVKYHLGYNNAVTLNNGKKVKLNLAPNPSHLETVIPVIEGICRAKIDLIYKKDFHKIVPVAIHGDAAIAAQGIVYEVIQMSELEGYKTGGTIHIIINNQVGFTTNYLEGRSSTYCTDIAKVTKAPVFHINGDDVEAIVFTIKMAIEYRMEFQSDVFIDILSYRKYGHNEGDEPRFTQPLLYKAIAIHPNPRDIYSQKLVSQSIFTEAEIIANEKEFDDFLESKFALIKDIKRLHIKQFLQEDWKGYIHPATEDFFTEIKTGVAIKKLKDLGARINYLPHGVPFFNKTIKLVDERNKMISEGKVDWAMAELLAYGSLITQGIPVRLSGQDSVRGTFSHRHAAHVIDDTDAKYFPMNQLAANQETFRIYNSHLSEYGVLGFEYGYALASPKALTIWEAQFGDFHNVAQVIIDQYISSAEEKWGIMNGLVLFLPHGYEGQGPEHSSARI
jgi:2-oxoglutarate dehydrogenase E1 component